MGHTRGPGPKLVLLLAFFTFTLPGTAWAQKIKAGQEAQPGKPTAPAAPVPPADPLKRETPYGAITGFLRAAGQKNYELAATYLQIPRRKPSERDQITAREFEAILNHDYFGSLDAISRDPEGNLEDGLQQDRESIGKARILGGRTLDIELARVTDPKVGKIWLVSEGTVRQVPEFYESMPFTALQNSLPDWLNRTEFLSLTVLELLLFLLALPVAWAVVRLVLFTAAWFVRHFIKRVPWAGWGQPRGLFTRTPLRLALTAVLHYLLVHPVLPLLYVQYYGRVVRILFVIAIYWLISSITDEAVARIEVRLPSERRASARSLLGLGRTVWKVLVALVLLLIALKSFGFEVSSALAGIGIGGIALGLGAQKTLENFFGGVSVLSDGTIRVGDFCKVADQTGTVEHIGLRATRIRTNARTVVSIPNGAIATINLENYGVRDKILLNKVISLRYETSADQLRYVIARIRELLYRHPNVESGNLRVRFVNLGTSSLDLEIFAYVLTAVYPEFLAVQEELLLRIMDIVDESGTGFAFPSQTTYIGKDPGLHPEKTLAALAVVENWRKENCLPFPDHDAETIARLEQFPDIPDAERHSRSSSEGPAAHTPKR